MKNRDAGYSALSGLETKGCVKTPPNVPTERYANYKLATHDSSRWDGLPAMEKKCQLNINGNNNISRPIGTNHG
jgi:hypothetical protein